MIVPLLLLLGGGFALAMAASSTSTPSGVAMPAWMDRVIARVSKHEAPHGARSLNLNLDGAGLSFGILQWAQKPGSLGKLLAEMHRRAPDRFQAVFGEAWRELLEVTARGALEPVAGAQLWTGPWPDRFRAAGADPQLAAIQVEVAATGEHWRGAVAADEVLGVRTERSLALCFDTSVQQGPAKAVSIAKDAVAGLRREGHTSVSVSALLRRYAALCAAPFRRTTAPTAPHPSRHIEWRKTGDEWHAWAGKFDLYADITRRRTSILSDTNLSDAPLESVSKETP